MPVDGDLRDDPSEPIDRLVIALRAYVRKAPKKPKKDSKPPRNTLPGAINWRDLAPRTTPSDWVLVFDCETRTTPDQRLRFGGYQLRYKGEVWESGAFYEPDVLSEEELVSLQTLSVGRGHQPPALSDNLDVWIAPPVRRPCTAIQETLHSHSRKYGCTADRLCLAVQSSQRRG
jgi:hypothetical protein